MDVPTLAVNAAFFRIGVIAYNLFVLFKHSVLGGDWAQHKVATVRWRLFHLPGKVALAQIFGKYPVSAGFWAE